MVGDAIPGLLALGSVSQTEQDMKGKPGGSTPPWPLLSSFLWDLALFEFSNAKV